MAGLQANWDFLSDFQQRGTLALDALRAHAAQSPWGVASTGRILDEPRLRSMEEEGCKQVACLAPPALLAPQPGEARGGAQFVARVLCSRAIARAVRNEASALAGSGYGKRPVSSPRKR